MTATCASAQTVNWGFERQQAEKASIEYFLNTEVGKHFSEQQVREAMQQGKSQAGKRQAAAQEDILLVNETFDKWTAGSNDAPDATLVDGENQEAVDALCDQAGWGAFLCYQAGGAVYQGFDEVGEDGPGYLMTPDFDMTKNQGIMRFKARVKNVNENATDANLQYFVLKNVPGEEGIILANVLEMTYGEWTDVEFTTHADASQVTVMFFSWKGKVLVDNVTVEDVIYALDTPSDIKVEAVSGTSIKVSCAPIEGATTYTFTAYSRNSEKSYTVASSEPEAVIEGEFDANEDVIIHVVASNATDQSYEGVSYGPISYNGEIAAPVALSATDVTNLGFTANWEASEWANTYELSLTRTHTVGEEPETYYYMQEDFSEVTMSLDDPSSTVMTSDGTPVSLDPYINAKGWNTYLASVSTGMLAITNLYEAYGFPGLLVSDQKNFSYGGGKVRVSGMGLSTVDDVVIKVGFAQSQGFGYTFLDGAKEFELTTAGSMFDVEIEGGTENSIMMFKMVDAAPSGDMAAFLSLNISTEAAAGDQISGVYDIVTLPGTTTSYDVEVDFPAGDSFTYNVVGKFGDNSSAVSEDITVEAPGALAIERIEAQKLQDAIFTLDGRRVKASNIAELENGTYIVRGEKVVK